VRILMSAIRVAGRLLAGFILLNAAGELLRTGFALDHFWINSPRVLGPAWRVGALLLAAALLLPESLLARRAELRRASIALCLLFEFFACLDAGRFWWLLLAGVIRTPSVLPFSLLVALLTALSALRISRCDSSWRPAAPRSLVRRLAVGSAAGGLIALLGLLALLFTYGPTDYRAPADCAVVLGSRAYPDGSPSLALYDRAMTGIELYRRGLVGKIVMSGGVDHYQDGTRISEPEVCRRLALECGVPDEDIIIDEQGVNSWATVVNTRRLAESHGWREVLLVSHYYHLPRLRLAADRAGLPQARTVPCTQTRRLRQEPWSIARECAGLGYYYFFK
jgi:uncharacterized SAM-binding protein YcdF (DUF218 family)